MTMRAAYADYAFPKMLDTLNLNRWDYGCRTIASHIFGIYFNWSFANKTWDTPPRVDSWEGALWEIRQRCGQGFTDSALFYMFKTLGDFPDPRLSKHLRENTMSIEDFNAYFSLGFSIGEQVVDNQLHHLAEVNQILNKRGLLIK
jgi:hypothetical protein